MKNVVIAILGLAFLVTGYMAATSRLRMQFEGMQGKTAVLKRGDLTLPVNATGNIRPYRRVEIKAEASGEVVEVLKQPGDRVKAGELIIRIDPDEEQRSVKRAQLDVEASQAKREDARLSLEQAKASDLMRAEASVASAEQQVKYSKFRWDKYVELPDTARNEEEMIERQTTYQKALAALNTAKADLERAKVAVPRAEQFARQAEAAYETMKNNLADAERRLSKTDIASPMDGIVGDVNTQVGEVIQGGKTTFTGGTLLASVIEMDRLIVQAEVDEADIGRVLRLSPAWAQPGRRNNERMPVDLGEIIKTKDHLPLITVESFPDDRFTGIVERIYPEPKNLAGVVTYLVDVIITENLDSKLLPGMRADVSFTSEHVENVVLCPTEAIKRGVNGELGVYVPKNDPPPGETAEPEFIPCELGLDNGNFAEVRSGVAEGAKVYVTLPAKRDADEGKSKGKRARGG